MSLPWLLVRGANANPAALKFSALMNKQNMSENETFKPEKRDPDIISKHTEDTILLQDPFSFRKLRYINNLHFFGPFEPDGVKLKYWCRFNTIKRGLHDHSFSKNLTYPVGKPRLCIGPDDGSKGGTIVTRINKDPTSTDYFYTPDAAGIRVSGMTTGFSIYLVFGFDAIAQHNSIDPTIAMKVDASDGANGWMLRVGVNGELKWFVRRAGTTRNFISENNKITTGRYIAVVLTYTASGNVMTMRIDNETQTDSADESPTFPTAHRLDLFHGIGPNQNSGKMVGRFGDSRWYNDLILDSDQQDNIWNNKRSISPTQYGLLSIAGHSHFNTNVYTGGYDSDGYDTTGFET